MKSVFWLVFTGRPGCPQTEACPSLVPSASGGRPGLSGSVVAKRNTSVPG